MTTLEVADFERDRWGRPLILVDGKKKPYQRPSSLGDCIDNRWNLELWQKRMVAQGLATDHAVYATAVALDADDKSGWNEVVDKAMAAMRSSAKAELGTALHKMTERVDRGEALDLPPVFAADITAYHAALKAAGLRVLDGMIECRCANDEVEAAGTFDRLLVDDEGNVYVGDVKTGASSDYVHGFAVQLATYAQAVLYDPGTGARTPMPDRLDRSRGVIIHLPAGEARCTLKWIDLDKGWEAAKVAHWVRQTWQKDKKLTEQIAAISAPASPILPVEASPASSTPNQGEAPVSKLALDRLRNRIAELTLDQRSKLKAVWPAGVNLKSMTSLPIEQERELRTLVDQVAPRAIEAPAAAPDEGREADPSAIASLREKQQALDESASHWLQTIIRQQQQSLSLDVTPSLRRFEIRRGLVALARDGMTDRLPELVAVTLGDQPGSPSALLASMSADEAVTFARHVDDAVYALRDVADEPPTLLPAS